MEMVLFKKEEEKKQVSVNLYVSTIDELAKISVKEGISVPNVMRSALNYFLHIYKQQQQQHTDTTSSQG